MIDLRLSQLRCEVSPRFTRHDPCDWAMPCGPRSHPLGQALLRVLAADAVSIAIAAFCVAYFGLQLVRGAL